MLFLSKEATSMDQQLKTQMLISLKDDESNKTETVWKENGFFMSKEVSGHYKT